MARRPSYFEAEDIAIRRSRSETRSPNDGLLGSGKYKASTLPRAASLPAMASPAVCRSTCRGVLRRAGRRRGKEELGHTVRDSPRIPPRG